MPHRLRRTVVVKEWSSLVNESLEEVKEGISNDGQRTTAATASCFFLQDTNHTAYMSIIR